MPNKSSKNIWYTITAVGAVIAVLLVVFVWGGSGKSSPSATSQPINQVSADGSVHAAPESAPRRQAGAQGAAGPSRVQGDTAGVQEEGKAKASEAQAKPKPRRRPKRPTRGTAGQAEEEEEQEKPAKELPPKDYF